MAEMAVGCEACHGPLKAHNEWQKAHPNTTLHDPTVSQLTVYMQRHPRRDHGFTIPDPLLTKELTIPNACNRCHADQSTDWSLKYTDEWYGTNMNRSTRERARWIAAAESGDDASRDKLVNLLADTNQPAYWRAVAATFLESWANEPLTKSVLLAQLKNEHPLVRERVVRALEPAVADTNVLTALQPLLNDPLRNVRVAAAWTVRSSVDMRSKAGQDLQRMLDLEADQPTGQFEAAMLLLSRQQPAEALVHLKKTTAWDPISPPFLCTQAQVQDQLGRLSEPIARQFRPLLAVTNSGPLPAYRLPARGQEHPIPAPANCDHKPSHSLRRMFPAPEAGWPAPESSPATAVRLKEGSNWRVGSRPKFYRGLRGAGSSKWRGDGSG
jgi:hypothetical protein